MQPPTPSWGNMLSANRGYLLTQIFRPGEMMKTELQQVHVEQVIRFFRKGSILSRACRQGKLLH